ncbi:MAG: hypothetical protein KY469_10675 [Actinobacteria bacterium]|nr:hypothetical protein [Actinomycetota bacterium]
MMGWAKFDDQFTDHPKVVAAGPMAELLAMRAVIHCARYETDGHVQAAQLPRLAVGITSPKRHAAKLVEAGLWEPDPDGDGWWVHDFLEYHPSSEQQQEKRAEARERMRRVRANKGRRSREQNANGKANRSRSSPYPVPDPVPEPQDQDQNPLSPDGDDELVLVDEDDEQTLSTFQAWWELYPPRNGKRIGKGKALQAWRRLSLEQRRRAWIGARNLAASDQLPKDPVRFLRPDTAGEFPFDDWQTPATSNGSARDGPDYDAVFAELQAREAAEQEQEAGRVGD